MTWALIVGHWYEFLFHIAILVSVIGHFQWLDHGCETAFHPPTTVWRYPSAVPLGVKDVFVWLTKTPAPSAFLFVVCYTNVLTYLLNNVHMCLNTDVSSFLVVVGIQRQSRLKAALEMKWLWPGFHILPKKLQPLGAAAHRTLSRATYTSERCWKERRRHESPSERPHRPDRSPQTPARRQSLPRMLRAAADADADERRRCRSAAAAQASDAGAGRQLHATLALQRRLRCHLRHKLIHTTQYGGSRQRI